MPRVKGERRLEILKALADSFDYGTALICAEAVGAIKSANVLACSQYGSMIK